MKVIFLKLLRDFRHAKGKLLLLVLATALSAWGISGVVYSYYLTERDFEENFQQTFPADMAILVKGFKPEVMSALLAMPAVEDLERREMVYARVKDEEGSYIPIIIYAFDDLADMRYDRIKFNEAQNARPNQFLIEQNAFFFFADQQKQVELIFSENWKPVVWKVDGKVHDARQAPARMERMVYAYSTSIEPLLPYLPDGQRRLLVKTKVSDDKAALEALAVEITKTVEAHGAEVSGITIPEPGEHIHQGIVDGISFLQQSGGLILALMGIVLLSLILLTWVYPQLSDIGVMKAIGAPTGHIFKSYVLVLLCIIILGVLVGLPLGYLTASLYSGAVAFFQNFEQVSGLLPLPIHLLVMLICLLVPLSFGIRPLIKSARVTVNEALNKVFYIPQQGIFKLSQRLISSPQMQYSLNNLFRQSQRSLLLLLLLAVGLALYFTSTNVDHSIREDMKEYAQSAPYEVVAFLPYNRPDTYFNFLDELSFVESSVPLLSQRVSYLPPDHSRPELTRLRTFSTDFELPSEMMLRGRLDVTCDDCLYVTGEGIREQFDSVELGMEVTLTGIDGLAKSYRFSGVIKDMVIVGAPFVSFSDEVVKDFNALAFKLGHTANHGSAIALSNEIEKAFTNKGINLDALNTVERRVGGIIGHLDPSFLIIKITGIFTIVLGLFGLIIVLNLTIRERTREIGIMKSVGAPFRKISVLYNLEFALISIIAMWLGGLLSVPVATALIGVIADTIIGHPVAFKNDYASLILTILLVMLVQVILITFNNRVKISRNARALLDHHF